MRGAGFVQGVKAAGYSLDEAKAAQHGQRAVRAVPPLGSCASSGRAWWRWAACTPREAPSHCLWCSSYRPPKPPIPRLLTTQAAGYRPMDCKAAGFSFDEAAAAGYRAGSAAWNNGVNIW